MIELLRAAAARTPDQPAIVTADRAVSYADLVRQAETAAGELRNRGIDRFAVLEPDPAATWMLLAAASLAGAEACVYPLASTEEALARLRERLDHKSLVTSRELDGEGLVTACRADRRGRAVARRTGGGHASAADPHHRNERQPAGGPTRLGTSAARRRQDRPDAGTSLAAGVRAESVRWPADPAARRRGARDASGRGVVSSRVTRWPRCGSGESRTQVARRHSGGSCLPNCAATRVPRRRCSR